MAACILHRWGGGFVLFVSLLNVVQFMKRIVIALPFWAMAALCLPGMVQPLLAAPVVCLTELPASTVEAVLHRVAELRPYSVTQLRGMYDSGQLTISQSGSGYEVRIVDEDGIVDVLILQGL